MRKFFISVSREDEQKLKNIVAMIVRGAAKATNSHLRNVHNHHRDIVDVVLDHLRQNNIDHDPGHKDASNLSPNQYHHHFE